MERILVIEDDTETRKMIQRTLRKANFDVLDAEDGTTGIQMARAYVPDLVICDIKMEDMDGYSVLAKMRENPVTTAIPFILMTGDPSKSGRRKGMGLGADDYLAKPFTMGGLLSAINARFKRQRDAQKEVKRRFDAIRTSISMALPHEFRMPLSIILGYAQMFRTEAQWLDVHEIVNMANTVYENCTRLQRLVENFLFYSQIELLAIDSERLQAWQQTQTRDADQLISEQATIKANQYGRFDDLTLHLDKHVVAISREYLTKIVDELLDNAFKFSEPTTPVSVVTTAKEGVFTLSVSDHGYGMEADHVAQIGALIQFERKSREQQGAGLGLAIATRLVELHGGSLQVRSKLDEGTIVTVNVPMAVAPGTSPDHYDRPL